MANVEAMGAYCAELDNQDPPYGNCSGVVWGRYASTEGQFGPKHEGYKLTFGTGGVMWAIVPRRQGDVK